MHPHACEHSPVSLPPDPASQRTAEDRLNRRAPALVSPDRPSLPPCEDSIPPLSRAPANAKPLHSFNPNTLAAFQPPAHSSAAGASAVSLPLPDPTLASANSGFHANARRASAGALTSRAPAAHNITTTTSTTATSTTPGSHIPRGGGVLGSNSMTSNYLNPTPPSPHFATSTATSTTSNANANTTTTTTNSIASLAPPAAGPARRGRALSSQVAPFTTRIAPVDRLSTACVV